MPYVEPSTRSRSASSIVRSDVEVGNIEERGDFRPVGEGRETVAEVALGVQHLSGHVDALRHDRVHGSVAEGAVGSERTVRPVRDASVEDEGLGASRGEHDVRAGRPRRRTSGRTPRSVRRPPSRRRSWGRCRSADPRRFESSVSSETVHRRPSKSVNVWPRQNAGSGARTRITMSSPRSPRTDVSSVVEKPGYPPTWPRRRASASPLDGAIGSPVGADERTRLVDHVVVVGQRRESETRRSVGNRDQRWRRRAWRRRLRSTTTAMRAARPAVATAVGRRGAPVGRADGDDRRDAPTRSSTNRRHRRSAGRRRRR